MLLQVLDIDYILVNELPVIRIFGRDENGKTVCGFYEGRPQRYLPYFYVVSESDMKEVLKGEVNLARVEKVKKFMALGYQKSKRDVWKVFLKNPAKTPDIRDRLVAKGYDVYEADIPFKYRFMSDFGINGLDWIETGSENPVSTSTVMTERTVALKNIKVVEGNAIPKLKYLALDIECVSMRDAGMPDARKDPIIMVSLVTSKPYKGEKSMVLSTRFDESVKGYESEKDMLQGLIDIITEYDPDVITGYNINNFDIPYILERMRQNETIPVFGRCKKQVTTRKFMSKQKVNITGRLIADPFEIIKKGFSLKRYDLNTVASTLLNESKEDVKKSDISKHWKGSQKDFRKLVSYCRKDSELAMDLLIKLKLLDKFFALSRITGTLIQDILDSGETTRIENIILREFNREGYIIPCRPRGSDVAKREKQRIKELKGGFVIEPKKGLHANVIVLDFKAMYPSLIRTFNICPTTLITGNYEGEHTVSPSGAKFVPHDVRKGIIPRILEGLTKERTSVKKLIRKETDKQRIMELDAKQWALKIMSNAFYGHFGYPRAKVYDLRIANSITAFGRETIKTTRDLIEKRFKYNVVYGDTDSVMVKVETEDLEKIREIGDSMSSQITGNLKGVMELEFEKVFKRFLPLTKKRYAAWSFEPSEKGWKEKIETKGIETVRRDWCDLVSETMKRVIEIILKENDIKMAVKYFKCVVNDMVNRKIPIQKLVVTKTMTKRADGYAGVQPHAELVKKMRKRSPVDVPGVGDRIGYVIVKGLDLLSKRAEDPNYVLEKGLEIDSKYYIENQMLPPLERIFSALEISKTELLGKGKQTSIMGALNCNSKKEKAPEIKSLPIEDVTGFFCKKCNKSYQMPPLKGTCECGGELEFSSSRGTSRYVVV